MTCCVFFGQFWKWFSIICGYQIYEVKITMTVSHDFDTGEINKNMRKYFKIRIMKEDSYYILFMFLCNFSLGKILKYYVFIWLIDISVSVLFQN